MPSGLFSKHFSEHVGYLGLKNTDVAKIIKKSAQAIGRYRRGEISPTLDDLPDIAKALGVTTDYLLGVTTTRKWGPEVENLRFHLRSNLDRVKYSSVLRHVVAVIRILQEYSELCKQEWFMAGILGIPVKEYKLLMDDQGQLEEENLERFAEFAGISTLWLKRLESQHLPGLPDIAEYYPAVAKLHVWGITGEELSQHAPAVRDMAIRNRRHLDSDPKA